MTESHHDRPATPPEQIIYANLLLIGVWFGLFLLVVTYGLYVSGVLPAHVSIPEVPNSWSVGVDQYLHDTASPHGWGWISLLHKGDFLNYVGFTFLALTTIFCYLVLMGAYLRAKDRLFFVICALEIAILAVAASGVLGTGGH
jgi:hypothetical protein